MLANETVHMLQYLTSEIVEPFLRPEIIDRLAAMLDYNLEILVGPKCTELKVSAFFLLQHSLFPDFGWETKHPLICINSPTMLLSQVRNPEKYHFDPKFLLGQLIDIYIHLFTPAFVMAVARDGRSYKKEYFLRAIKIGNEKLYKTAVSLIATLEVS
jgi:ubiquitin conjugation factor E4 B